MAGTASCSPAPPPSRTRLLHLGSRSGVRVEAHHGNVPDEELRPGESSLGLWKGRHLPLSRLILCNSKGICLFFDFDPSVCQAQPSGKTEVIQQPCSWKSQRVPGGWRRGNPGHSLPADCWALTRRVARFRHTSRHPDTCENRTGRKPKAGEKLLILRTVQQPGRETAKVVYVQTGEAEQEQKRK